MTKRKHSRTRFLIVIVAVIISVVAIFISRHYIKEAMQVHLQENLKDVAIQNEVTIENLLNEKQNMLFGIADEISNRSFSFDSPEQIWEIVEWLKNYDNIYDFKRMGIIAIDGTAYTTDGYEVELIDEPYNYGIQGIANISSTLVEAIGTQEPINVFSVPVFAEDGTTVRGILFATYRTENFKQLLNVDSFNGQGYSYIVQNDGSVIVDSDKSPMYLNVFDTMLVYDKENQDVIQRLQTAMAKKASGYESFHTINTRSLYYTPLHVDTINQTWYLYTIVPDSLLQEKVERIYLYQDILSLVVAIVITSLVLYFAFTYQKDEKLLRQMAYIDPMTGGHNMYAFREQLITRKVHWGYVISLDINDFKVVNSVCGIEKGNEVIKRIWQVVNESLNEREVAAHVSADHFVVYMQEVYKDLLLARVHQMSSDIEALADELQTIHLSPYFGIYEITGKRDPEENCNNAIQAKKLVKGSKTKNWAFYSEIDFDKIVQDKQLIDSFDEAVEKEEFEIWYQPKYNASTSRMVGAEALIRWRKKDGSLIPPYRFIPLFEENGMIVTLDEYVFEKVCRQQRRWAEEGKRIFPISVNISRASLYYSEVVDRYKDVLTSCKIEASLVPLEITESATINNAQIRGLVERFRKAGFSLHLDDFGSGYSSIATLNLIDFDVLKMDKSLVDFIGDEDGERLVVYTVKLAKSMGMSITAEGVETQEQVRFLDGLGCDDIQGYYFSKPLPLAEFEKLISE